MFSCDRSWPSPCSLSLGLALGAGQALAAETAFAHYDTALELNPKHRGANEYLGELYLELGRLEEAQARLDVLDGACFFGCEEYSELKAKIEAYLAKVGGCSSP